MFLEDGVEDVNNTFIREHNEKALKQSMQNMPEPLNFVRQKNECIKQRSQNKDWKRKIEIAEFEAKKARKILTKRDRALMQA